jgi:putative cell wall-binding protein
MAHPGTSSVVYVATGDNFPDALSAAPAAAQDGAPLLLTPGWALRADIAAEVRRLDPDQIIVVGGPGSVAPAVFDALKAIQPNTIRLSGIDRYAASRALVEFAFPDGAGTVYVSTGENFPDALSAAAAGGTTDAPVLLVPGRSSTLDAATLELLLGLDPDRILIAGGPGSVSPGIEARLASIAPTTRLGGNDRFDASLSVTSEAFTSADRVFLATGFTFPDALGGSAWAGSMPARLIVVPTSCIPPATLAEIRALGVRHITLLGGPGSLTPAVATLRPC